MEYADKREILNKLQSGYTLPRLSTAAAKLVELSTDDNSSIDDLADLIGKDASLTVRVLNLANSAFFRSAYPVTTLRQAVLRIGFHHLRILALSVSLKDSFPAGKVGIMSYRQFWRVSLYRGLLAKALAGALKMCEPEEALVAGLTLEIGFLLYFDLFFKGKNDCMDFGIYPLEALLSLETEKHGINHREIGEIALRYWRFPENIVACQHYYGQEGGSEPGPSGLSRICRMAGKLSALICYKDTDLDEVFHVVVSSFGLDNETIYEVVLSTLNEVDDIAKALDVPIDWEKDVFRLMEKTNRTLRNVSERMSRQGGTETNQELPSFDALRLMDKKNPDVAYALQAVAHEIRNPLTVVGGFARMLAKTIDPSSNSWKYVEGILEETRRLETALGDAARGLAAVGHKQ